MRFARCADIATVQQQPVVSVGNIVGRDVFHQFLFDLQRCVGRRRNESKPMAHAENVRIDRHRSASEPHGLHHIRRLATHARQFYQIVHIARHFTAEVAHHHPRHFHEVLRLRVRIAHAANILENLLRLSLGHRFRIGKSGEKRRRHLIDALVGALCAEQSCTKELESTAKLQLRCHHGHLLAEII